MSFNSINSGEDLSVSCGVKVSSNLNSNMSFGSGGGAAVVVAAGVLAVVLVGGAAVPFTGEELALP